MSDVEVMAAIPTEIVADQANASVTLAEIIRRLRESAEAFSLDLASKQTAVKGTAIVDDESCQQAADLRNLAASREKSLTALWDSVHEPVNKWRNLILSHEKATIGPWTKVKEALDSKIKAYARQSAQDKKQVDAQMSTVADQQRQQLNREADNLMAQGLVAEAEAKQRQANMTVAPQLPSAKPQVEGMRFTPKFRARPVDLMAILGAIARGEVPLMHDVKGEMRPLVVVDQVVLNALCSRLQDSLRIPGVVVEEDVDVRPAKL